jgi:ABC-2 type transport system ATP-binding protein
VNTDGLAVRRPSMDDVFLALTGHAAEEQDDEPAGGRWRRRRRGAATPGGSEQ